MAGVEISKDKFVTAITHMDGIKPKSQSERDVAHPLAVSCNWAPEERLK